MNKPPRFQPELVEEAAFLASNATIIGDVRIGAGSSIWFGSVLRGDTESIRIGCNTNVQDLCLLHADPGHPCILGDGVTLGHGAIVHGAQIEDDVMISMRSVVMNGVKVGTGSIIGAGAVIAEGAEIPPRSVVLGVPGKIVRCTNSADLEKIHKTSQHYLKNALTYAAFVPSEK